MFKKKLFSIVISAVLCLTFLSSTLTVSAGVKYDDMPDSNYTYWTTSTDKIAVPIKTIYDSVSALNVFDDSSELKHAVFDNSGRLYILDGLGKIAVLNRDYTLNRIITDFTYKGQQLTFEGASGIYLDDNNNLYVCDTENARIIVSKDGIVSKIIEKPKSSVIPSDLEFAPLRLVKDDRDYSYVLSDGCYYGLMVFNPDYEFLGFFGANSVASNPLDVITGLITSLFETAEKHESSVKKLPYQISDICMTSSGFVASVNSESEGQIRVFATTGSNILKYNSQFETGSGDSFNFADQPNRFLDITTQWSESIVQQFSAVASDKKGYLYALDKTQGRIYIYDENCNLIGVFGGGRGSGNQVGTFVTPISIAVFEDDVVVLDSYNQNFTVFKATEYGKNLKEAQFLTNEGEYTEAFPLWQEVNKADKNCQLAYWGLSKYCLEKKDYDKAMEFSKIGKDRVVYSQAFRMERNAWIKNNLYWLLPILLIIVAAVLIIPVLIRKKGKRIKIPDSLSHMLSVIFHPIKCFSDIKLYGKGNVKIATGILILFYIASISRKLLVGYMYRTVELTSFNSIYTLLGTVGVMLLYVIVNVAMCVLFEGKGKLRNVYVASCYCLVPQIIYSAMFVILSYVVVPNNNANMSMLSGVFSLILIVWLLLSITIIHDFSFFKAIGLAIVIVIGMGISAFIIFAIFTLAQDQLSFLIGLVKEILLL